ncbi:MAG: ParB N-terminal domain-containing protein [Methanobrevibacter sp.]|nr:ParB N-terminal domain-containing protein [Methanobrevibacter sp.]MBO7693684.1 ParB N-terminal domain-containing protein [Methanobrevibacter sp.]MBP5784680.1 ParB N-terminal domain-containing protein [Methanobrevibacter sp.]
MKIIEMEVSKIIPYERNNKIHDETQINRIANSIKEFGFRQPIVVDKNNIIIVGHGRFE